MDADESRSAIRRGRAVDRVALPAGPARDLQDALYGLYVTAGCPNLSTLASMIAADDSLPGSPKKDLISKIVSGAGRASQQDTITVAVALARVAGRDDADVVAQQVRRWWITARTAPAPAPPTRLGRPVSECDPLSLQVHPAIRIPGGHDAPLPEYVPRDHDTQLREVQNQLLADGLSRLITLVGGSSTGKTRACWELVQYMEQREPGRWWLWHPYDPTRPDAALDSLDRAGPGTIVWLNEAQFYLAPLDAGLGERIAAGLRTLLTDPDRAPVLVLATLWPAHWDELTSRPGPGEPDPYAQARDLLAGTMVSVADRFTLGEISSLRDTGVDPRVRQAADHAEGGRIAQYLAGAPDLLNYYRTASPAVRAVIQVAMDARRLGHPLALPLNLLEHAVPGYLDDHDWDALGEDWLEQALADTARPCKGARGPLTRIRIRPGDSTPAGGQPSYRLADYLEQAGRHDRAGMYPPESLWTTFATTITDPDLLRNLGREAENRARYQHAIWLYRRAADLGNTDAMINLAWLQEQAGGVNGAVALYRRAAECGSAKALHSLAWLCERAGYTAGAESLYRHSADRGYTAALIDLARMWDQTEKADDAVALVLKAADRGNTGALYDVAWLREQTGDIAGAEALYRRAVDCGDTEALSNLARLRRQAGDTTGAEALLRHGVDRGDRSALIDLARMWDQTEKADDAVTLVLEAADRGETDALSYLAWSREETGDTAGAEALWRQGADRGDTHALNSLARLRERTGDIAGADALWRQAADRGNTHALWSMAMRREAAGDTFGAEALALHAANRGNNYVLNRLALQRVEAGDTAGAEALWRQAVDRGDTHALGYLAATDSANGVRIWQFGLTGSGEAAAALDLDL